MRQKAGKKGHLEIAPEIILKGLKSIVKSKQS
jgi:hypothetical protein